MTAGLVVSRNANPSMKLAAAPIAKNHAATQKKEAGSRPPPKQILSDGTHQISSGGDEEVQALQSHQAARRMALGRVEAY